MDDVFETNKFVVYMCVCKYCYDILSLFSSTEPEEDLDDVPLTLKDAMEQLGLNEHRAALEKEQIDLDSLVGIN